MKRTVLGLLVLQSSLGFSATLSIGKQGAELWRLHVPGAETIHQSDFSGNTMVDTGHQILQVSPEGRILRAHGGASELHLNPPYS